MARAENIVTSHTVEINAPARVVWEVLIDLDNYHQWNSFCPHIRCGLQIGDEVHMQVLSPETGETVPVFEYLVACDPEQLLSWEQRPAATSTSRPSMPTAAAISPPIFSWA